MEETVLNPPAAAAEEVAEDEFPCFCEHCEDGCEDTATVNVRRSHRLTTQGWCEDCRDRYAFTCADCEEVFADNLRCGDNSNGEPVCQECIESYFTCEDCGHIYHNDDYGEDGHCRSCTPDSDDDSGVIQDYGCSPNLRPRGSGPVWFGVELEVECRAYVSTSAQETHRLVRDFAILKHDGSLNSGFEICTSPCSVAEHKRLWGPFFEQCPGDLRSYSTSTCGLHVHISRAPLTGLQIGKIVGFINAEQNAKFVNRLAQRSTHYAKIKHDKGVTAKPGIANPNDEWSSADRYEAVNLTNDNTIELRIFKGTLAPGPFFRAIEFAEAIVEFCGSAKRSVEQCLQWRVFADFVLKQPKRWKNLSLFCTREIGNVSGDLHGRRDECPEGPSP